MAVVLENEVKQRVDDFFCQLRQGEQMRQLFENLADVMFFVKDSQSRLITCNQAMLKFFGRRHVSEIYGKTGVDFFPESIASPYLLDDREVLDKGVELIDLMELALKEDGELSWFCTSKLPLRDMQGSIIGLMGTSRWMAKADQQLHPASHILTAVSYMQEHFAEELDIPQLAELCKLSVSQFHRSFKQNFRQTPLQFLLKLRIQAACRLLRTSELSIREVGEMCGFADQNYFSRHFRQVCSQTPRLFRGKYRI